MAVGPWLRGSNMCGRVERFFCGRRPTGTDTNLQILIEVKIMHRFQIMATHWGASRGVRAHQLLLHTQRPNTHCERMYVTKIQVQSNKPDSEQLFVPRKYWLLSNRRIEI